MTHPYFRKISIIHNPDAFNDDVSGPVYEIRDIQGDVIWVGRNTDELIQFFDLSYVNHDDAVKSCRMAEEELEHLRKQERLLKITDQILALHAPNSGTTIDKINTIKHIRMLTRWSLRETKDYVEDPANRKFIIALTGKEPEWTT